MVSTRNHPRTFPPPDLSPSKQPSTGSPVKRSTRSTSVADSSNGDLAVAKRSRARSTTAWSHTPSPLVLLWLAVSLPLVVWDTGYVLGRPHTMPGGKWQGPLYAPYKLYATVDLLYGWPAWERQDGFTGAQASMNVVETIMYGMYLYVVFARGQAGAKRRVVGRDAGWAVVLGFAATVMTLSKTVLYSKL
jgi:hypothetical protein